MTIPREIRTKRDEVLKGSFLEEPTKVREEEEGEANDVAAASSLKEPSEEVKREPPPPSTTTPTPAVGVVNSTMVPNSLPPTIPKFKPRKGVELNEQTPGMRSRRTSREIQEKEAALPTTILPNGDSNVSAEVPSRRRRTTPQTSLVKLEECESSNQGESQSVGDKTTQSVLSETGSSSSRRALTNSKVEKQTAQVVKRKRGRPPRHNPQSEVIYWVQCDLCNKWRIVSHPIPEGTTFWECKLRDDKTTCAMVDDEAMLKKKGGP
ncbi:unnamed protein product [Phytomonas sp. EM1]|nr:unnamed protein product [Phytomonas sp. EM1]|eukprot:CCW63114.1 unnamed protein product [Phytomonas sp. isolate EM1]